MIRKKPKDIAWLNFRKLIDQNTLIIKAIAEQSLVGCFKVWLF